MDAPLGFARWRDVARRGIGIMAISTRTRFEVFKRDKFTCQYCGGKAPDVLLHADHIHPVSAGGTDDLLNLTTACVSCNLGKADRKLSDDSAVQRKRTQLEDLQDRQEQISMMIEWQRSLLGMNAATVDGLAEMWEELAPGYALNAVGKQDLAKLLRRFGIEEVSTAMRIASEQYLQFESGSEAVTQESWTKAFLKIGGICRTRAATVNKPYLQDLYYIRGILRRKVADGSLSWMNDQDAAEWLETAFSWGVPAADLNAIARKSRTWTSWKNDMSDAIETHRQQREG